MEDKNQFRRGFQTALAACLFQIVLALIFYFLYTRINSPLILLENFHILIGIPIFAILLLIFHQRYRESLEKEEVEELTQREGRIFRDDESVILISRVRLRQTQKWAMPILGFLISIALIYVAFRAIYFFRGRPLTYEANLAICFPLIGLTFAVFVFSRYVLGMSREKQLADLSAIGTYLGVNALFTFLITLSIALRYFGLTRIEWFVFYALSFLLIFAGIEYLLNILVSFYRVTGTQTRTLFDSRIYYFLSTPEEVIPSFSEIIDVQFGFHITQTWFYQFIRNRIVPLFMLWAFLLYILTSIVIVQPYERAFIEFLGKPVSEVSETKLFGPGLHFKFPFPIGKAKIYDVDRIKRVRVGVSGVEGERVLWTERHYEEEFPWIIASQENAISASSTAEKPVSSAASETVPISFLSGAIWVYYKIDSENLFDYAYKHSAPESVLEGIIYNKFTEIVMNVDFFDILNVNRLPLTNILKQRVQDETNEKELGVEIISVSFENIHPPLDVASSFEKVVGAMEKKEATILTAEAYQNRELTLVDYTASAIQIEAESYKQIRTLESQARGEEFKKKLKAYSENPLIFKYRYYLKTLDDSLISPKKFIVISPESNRDVIIIDMQKSSLPDIFPLGLEAEKGNPTSP
ncbi:MAG: SPFH domain-containing protein [Candidatus Ratteibacteria bacterium]|nr:SPFH domain-containing protein [Candidatus Ratteibacteria bacterium]